MDAHGYIHIDGPLSPGGAKCACLPLFGGCMAASKNRVATRAPRRWDCLDTVHHGLCTLFHPSDGSDHSFQPPPKSKGGKMLGLINWRLKVTINDGRAFIGQMLAFDKHMNLVLADCEEFRHVRPKKKPGESEAGPEQEMKRSLGLVILRGETVVSLSVEGPPPVQDDDKKNAVCATSNSREVHLNHSFFSRVSASCWTWSRDASRAWNGNGPPLCVLYCRRTSIDCHLLLSWQPVPRHSRDPRCHSRHLACQAHLPVSAPLGFRRACLSPLLLGSVALLLGKTIVRAVKWMTC